VVQDAQDHDFRDQPRRRFYVSYFQPIDGITTANFEIRTNERPGGLSTTLEEELAAVNRNLQIVSLKDVRELMDATVVQERLIAKLSSFFGALAIILAAFGVYGVVSYSVARKTNEIGIRIALGAEQSTVIRMVMGEVLALIGIGGAAGIAAAYAAAHLLNSLLFGLTLLDPIAYGGAIFLLVAIGAFAAYVPALRAARIDPMVAVRCE
jgi:ABC-type antimicrobial peptide transport system permease subunit